MVISRNQLISSSSPRRCACLVCTGSCSISLRHCSKKECRMSRTMYTTGTQLPAHTLTAHNDAAASANKIHDDTVARQYGFRGGLVAGISVYAYMTDPPVPSVGEARLKRGTAQGQFAKTVF